MPLVPHVIAFCPRRCWVIFLIDDIGKALRLSELCCFCLLSWRIEEYRSRLLVIFLIVLVRSFRGMAGLSRATAVFIRFLTFGSILNHHGVLILAVFHRNFRRIRSKAQLRLPQRSLWIDAKRLWLHEAVFVVLALDVLNAAFGMSFSDPLVDVDFVLTVATVSGRLLRPTIQVALWQILFGLVAPLSPVLSRLAIYELRVLLLRDALLLLKLLKQFLGYFLLRQRRFQIIRLLSPLRMHGCFNRCIIVFCFRMAESLLTLPLLRPLALRFLILLQKPPGIEYSVERLIHIIHFFLDLQSFDPRSRGLVDDCIVHFCS